MCIKCICRYLAKLVRFPSPRRGTADGVPYIQGHVEIFHDGIWGTICDDQVNDGAAIVLCKMAGYSYGGDYRLNYRQYLSNKASKIWLDDLSCRGTESDVSRCRHRPWGINNCNHGEDVGIRCYTDRGTFNTATLKGY